MKGEDHARRLIDVLRASAKRRGHGTQTRALRACDLGEDYFYNARPERVPLGTYLDLVLAAGLEPADQAERALAADDPVVRFIDDGRLIREQYAMPELLARARRQAAVGKEPSAGGFDLEAIDARRYEDVGEATTLARQAVLRARGPDAVSAALGVWASCQRMRYRLDWASGALGLAVEIADASCSSEVMLHALQRASPLLTDRGELDLALSVARKVAIGYLERGKLVHFGQAMVDCSVIVSFENLDSAAELAKIGLAALQGSSPRNQAAAYQFICRERARQGDFDAAAEAADQAAYWAAQAGGPELIGRVHWLRAIVATEREDLYAAEHYYYQALEALAAATYDAVLVGAELVRVLLRAGRPIEAHATAKSLAWFEHELRDDPLDIDRRLVRALLDLVQAGEDARLTLELIEQIIGRIESGRRQRVDRLRQRLRA